MKDLLLIKILKTVILANNIKLIGQTPGTKKWEFLTEGLVYSSPAIGSDGTVYVGSGDNKVYAIASSSEGLAESPWPKSHANNKHTGEIASGFAPLLIIYYSESGLNLIFLFHRILIQF
jgi:PQQ-like domain